MTLEEIKAAVEAGEVVYWKNPGYRVIKDSIGQWLVECQLNGHCTGLTWRDGVTTDYNLNDFFVLELG